MSNKFGVSFSLHRASELGLDKQACLSSAIDDLGFRRFRLMSYWNIHEQRRGTYNFDELDWQIDLIAKASGEITLCLGKRQPRWPECHLPDWAHDLPRNEWRESLYTYIETVVQRYRDRNCITSWQLENEALLKDFGYCADQDFDRNRLDRELKLIKKIDPSRPVIMTLSDSYGLPIRKPHPDQHAMSLYRITINQHGDYAYSLRPPLFYKTRATLIRLLTGKKPFIHELQAEPWLQSGITETTISKQLKHMNPKIFNEMVSYACRTGISPIDLWGLEWWYWLKKQKHPEIWDAVKARVTD